VKFLVDNALPPSAAEALRTAGHDAVHVRDRGLADATDTVVFEIAAREHRILISQDTDFGTLLATRDASEPSVILLRRSDKGPAALVACLLANLPPIAEHLERGSVVVIEDQRIRVRRLPFSGPPR
jgi:predicted nuclease of predicted toxin-antitoxin system